MALILCSELHLYLIRGLQARIYIVRSIGKYGIQRGKYKYIYILQAKQETKNFPSLCEVEFMWQIIWTVESETCLLQYPLFDCMYQRRIQITISLSGSTNTELQARNIFPLYVLLARPTSNVSLEGVSLAFISLWNE